MRKPDKQCLTVLSSITTEDAVSEIRPRKHAELWQRYLHWLALQQTLVAHELRYAAIKSGRSAMDLAYEERRIKSLQPELLEARDEMIEEARLAEPELCAWLSSIKGLAAGSLAAQLVAIIDDAHRFATVDKLWRYAGYAVFDGKAEGKDSQHYCRQLKSLMYLIVSQFIRQNTPTYRELYDAEKDRLRLLHPQGYQDERGRWHYNDGHLHTMAIRVVAKTFLRHLREVWVG